jgi:hypothetical protein
MTQPVARGLAAAGRAATAGQFEAAMGAQGGAGQGWRRRGRRSMAAVVLMREEMVHVQAEYSLPPMPCKGWGRIRFGPWAYEYACWEGTSYDPCK